MTKKQSRPHPPMEYHGHNQYNSLEYRCWVGMRQRCLDKQYKGYKNHGGRGIKICKRWDSFTMFLEDMGPRPSREYSIDRINNDGNYQPSNCRWATKKEQARNTRPRTQWAAGKTGNNNPAFAAGNRAAALLSFGA